MINNFRLLALFGAFFLMPSMLPADSNLASSVFATEKNEVPSYRDVKTRKRASVGKTCAEALDIVQREGGPIDSELWSEAKSMLNDIERRPRVCASDYEQSQVWNMLGYVYYSMNDVTGASGYYRNVLEGVGTPPETKLDMSYMLAQLYVMQDEYALAVEQFEIWMDAVIAVGTEQRLMMAQLYHLFGREDEALEMANLGIAEAEAKDVAPKDDFWKLQLSIYFQKKNYQKVKSLIEKLGENDPDWVY